MLARIGNDHFLFSLLFPRHFAVPRCKSIHTLRIRISHKIKFDELQTKCRSSVRKVRAEWDEDVTTGASNRSSACTLKEQMYTWRLATSTEVQFLNLDLDTPNWMPIGSSGVHWLRRIFYRVSNKSGTEQNYILFCFFWPPLWSSGQSYWLQMKGSRVRFPGTTKK
jgi:hypothetical protein